MDEAFLPQHPEGFPHGEPGDVEFGGEVALHQPGAGRVMALEDS